MRRHYRTHVCDIPPRIEAMVDWKKPNARVWYRDEAGVEWPTPFITADFSAERPESVIEAIRCHMKGERR